MQKNIDLTCTKVKCCLLAKTVIMLLNAEWYNKYNPIMMLTVEKEQYRDTMQFESVFLLKTITNRYLFGYWNKMIKTSYIKANAS